MSIFATLFLVLFLASGATLWNLILRQETFLEGLCYHLGAGRYQRSRLQRSTRAYSFSGRILGRQFVVAYRYRPKGFRFPFSVHGELEIQMPVLQKFWLRMLARQDDAEQPESMTVHDDLIDSLYSVHCNQPEAGLKFLESPAAQSAFRSFRHPFNKLEIHRGWLKITYNYEVLQEFVTGDLEYVLDILVPMINAYEEQAALLKAAIIIAAADEICPYCRGELDTRKDSVVSCTQCRTRLHEACWKENGQCTTWGCRSTVPTRV